MKHFEISRENFNHYEVRLSQELLNLNLKKIPQLAYAVNPETFTVIISKSGHGKIMRSYDKHDFEGGWIFPPKGKISFCVLGTHFCRFLNY
jgi:hypothetical protein